MGREHRQPRKYWDRWIMVGSVAILAFWITVGGRSSPEARSRTEVKPAELSPVPEGATVTYTSPDRESFKAYYDLLRTHPHEGVRGEFRGLVYDRQMYILTGALGVAIGVFGRARDEGGNVFSALVLDPQLLLPRNRPLAQLTIYHEYLHYLQWRDGTIAEDAFVLRPDFLPPEKVDAWCREKWHAERLAYQEACAFGRQQGLLDNLRSDGGPLQTICAADEDQYIPTLKRVFQLVEPSRVVCAQTWGRI